MIHPGRVFVNHQLSPRFCWPWSPKTPWDGRTSCSVARPTCGKTLRKNGSSILHRVGAAHIPNGHRKWWKEFGRSPGRCGNTGIRCCITPTMCGKKMLEQRLLPRFAGNGVGIGRRTTGRRTEDSSATRRTMSSAIRTPYNSSGYLPSTQPDSVSARFTTAP